MHRERSRFLTHTKLMHEMDYRLVYTDHGSYLQLKDKPKCTNASADEFWKQFRKGVSAVIALPLTVASYLY